MKYITHNGVGEIISVGTYSPDSPKQAFAHFTDPVILDVPEEIGLTTHYVQDGAFEPFPEKPGECYTFNWVTKSWAPDPSLADKQARGKRAELLAASDWTQLPDVPLETKNVWVTYRQALRDITEQTGYPRLATHLVGLPAL